MPALQASAGSVSVNRCSIHACLGEQALARAGDRPTAMYTQPPLAQPPAASSTSILRDSVRGDEPNPRPTATETHRDMAMADSSASMVSGSRRADVDVPGDRGVGAPASSVSQPTVISASSGASTDALQTSSSDLSHLTSTDMADADLTPLTSTSTLSTAFSSQESSTVSEPHVPAEPAMRTTGTDAQIAVSVPLASDVRSNGSLSTSVPDSLSNATTPRVELVQGQKRTAAGEVKPSSYGAAPQSPGSNGFAARGRSRTMSIGSNGSRIAELSAHLRARLSYAAAKVERSWQSRGGDDRDQSRSQQSMSPTASTSTIRDSKRILGSPRIEMSRSERQWYSGSPESFATSAPDLFTPHNSNSLNGWTRIAPGSPMDLTSPIRSTASRSSVPPPQTAPSDRPRLAPPVDIVSSSGSSSRRCSNPNGTSLASSYDPYPRHRRHFSQQELRASNTAGSNGILVPGTPPLQNLRLQSGSNYLTPSISSNMPPKERTPSQNALMEQDAIETLLFMSSPENSGYHPGSRPRHTNLSTSIEAQAGLGLNGMGTGTQSSQGSKHNPPRRVSFADGEDVASAYASGSRHNSTAGLEAQAGDEIDRMLDQMDSDSDDERHYDSRR